MMLSAVANNRRRLQELLSGDYLTHDENIAADDRLKPIIMRLPPSLAKLVIYSGISYEELHRRLRVLLLVAAASFFVAFLCRQPLVLFLPVGACLIEYWRLSRRVFTRAENFERDYTSLLLSLASAVRTGLDPLAALCHAHELFPQDTELAAELRLVNRGIERGLTEDEVIARFASSVNHPDLDLFRTAFLLARKEGASLGDSLQRLVRVTRNRQSFRRKIRTALATQKLSAIGIAGCAVAIGFLQFVSNHQALSLALNHPVAVKILIFGAALILFGLGWMLQLSREKL